MKRYALLMLVLLFTAPINAGRKEQVTYFVGGIATGCIAVTLTAAYFALKAIKNNIDPGIPKQIASNIDTTTTIATIKIIQVKPKNKTISYIPPFYDSNSCCLRLYCNDKTLKKDVDDFLIGWKQFIQDCDSAPSTDSHHE